MTVLQHAEDHKVAAGERYLTLVLTGNTGPEVTSDLDDYEQAIYIWLGIIIAFHTI